MGIVVLALVAVFLGLRLYSVLGKRTGHEQTFAAPEAAAPPVARRAAADAALPTARAADNVFEGSAAPGVRAIVAAEPGFDVARFMEGAQGAYRMILDAYWKGDDAVLRAHTAPAVHEAFADAIAARAAAGHVLDNRLVAINKATIADAGLDNGVARITVAFDADIAAVTRDAEGRVVAGSLTDAVPTNDLWTFTRTLRSSDPNWMLTDTDEAA